MLPLKWWPPCAAGNSAQISPLAHTARHWDDPVIARWRCAAWSLAPSQSLNWQSCRYVKRLLLLLSMNCMWLITWCSPHHCRVFVVTAHGQNVGTRGSRLRRTGALPRSSVAPAHRSTFAWRANDMTSPMQIIHCSCDAVMMWNGTQYCVQKSTTSFNVTYKRHAYIDSAATACAATLG